MKRGTPKNREVFLFTSRDTADGVKLYHKPEFNEDLAKLFEEAATAFKTPFQHFMRSFDGVEHRSVPGFGSNLPIAQNLRLQYGEWICSLIDGRTFGPFTVRDWLTTNPSEFLTSYRSKPKTKDDGEVDEGLGNHSAFYARWFYNSTPLDKVYGRVYSGKYVKTTERLVQALLRVANRISAGYDDNTYLSCVQIAQESMDIQKRIAADSDYLNALKKDASPQAAILLDTLRWLPWYCRTTKLDVDMSPAKFYGYTRHDMLDVMVTPTGNNVMMDPLYLLWRDYDYTQRILGIARQHNAVLKIVKEDFDGKYISTPTVHELKQYYNKKGERKSDPKTLQGAANEVSESLIKTITSLAVFEFTDAVDAVKSRRNAMAGFFAAATSLAPLSLIARSTECQLPEDVPSLPPEYDILIRPMARDLSLIKEIEVEYHPVADKRAVDNFLNSSAYSYYRDSFEAMSRDLFKTGATDLALPNVTVRKCIVDSLPAYYYYSITSKRAEDHYFMDYVHVGGFSGSRKQLPAISRSSPITISRSDNLIVDDGSIPNTAFQINPKIESKDADGKDVEKTLPWWGEYRVDEYDNWCWVHDYVQARCMQASGDVSMEPDGAGISDRGFAFKYTIVFSRPCQVLFAPSEGIRKLRVMVGKTERKANVTQHGSSILVVAEPRHDFAEIEDPLERLFAVRQDEVVSNKTDLDALYDRILARRFPSPMSEDIKKSNSFEPLAVKIDLATQGKFMALQNNQCAQIVRATVHNFIMTPGYLPAVGDTVPEVINFLDSLALKNTFKWPRFFVVLCPFDLDDLPPLLYDKYSRAKEGEVFWKSRSLKNWQKETDEVGDYLKMLAGPDGSVPVLSLCKKTFPGTSDEKIITAFRAVDLLEDFQFDSNWSLEWTESGKYVVISCPSISPDIPTLPVNSLRKIAFTDVYHHEESEKKRSLLDCYSVGDFSSKSQFIRSYVENMVTRAILLTTGCNIKHLTSGTSLSGDEILPEVEGRVASSLRAIAQNLREKYNQTSLLARIGILGSATLTIGKMAETVDKMAAWYEGLVKDPKSPRTLENLKKEDWFKTLSSLYWPEEDVSRHLKDVIALSVYRYIYFDAYWILHDFDYCLVRPMAAHHESEISLVNSTADLAKIGEPALIDEFVLSTVRELFIGKIMEAAL